MYRNIIAVSVLAALIVLTGCRTWDTVPEGKVPLGRVLQLQQANNPDPEPEICPLLTPSDSIPADRLCRHCKADSERKSRHSDLFDQSVTKFPPVKPLPPKQLPNDEIEKLLNKKLSEFLVPDEVY